MARRLALREHHAFLACARERHDNGGAFLVAFDVGEESTFDWHASHDSLHEDGILDRVLVHCAVRAAQPALGIPDRLTVSPDFKRRETVFDLDGVLANLLYRGGAYWRAGGDGRTEKELALAVCDAAFGLRYGEVMTYSSRQPWLPWFKDGAWDWTVAALYKRLRRLWLFVVTDAD